MSEGVGIKLGGDLAYHDGDCGGSAAADPGPEDVTATYTAGEEVSVSWDTTISHPSSPGVRVAVSYGDVMEFGSHVLASGVAAGGKGLHSTTVILPSDMVGPAVLQFSWVSNADGGSYIGCADINVVEAEESEENEASEKEDKNTRRKKGATGFLVAVSVFVIMYLAGGLAHKYRKDGTLEHPHKKEWATCFSRMVAAGLEGRTMAAAGARKQKKRYVRACPFIHCT